MKISELVIPLTLERLPPALRDARPIGHGGGGRLAEVARFYGSLGSLPDGSIGRQLRAVAEQHLAAARRREEVALEREKLRALASLGPLNLVQAYRLAQLDKQPP